MVRVGKLKNRKKLNMKDTKEFILKNKVVTICRKVYGEDLLNLAKALSAGGVKMIEVTFDQQDPDCIAKTSEAIHMLVDYFKGDMRFGAGTVLNAKQVEAAYKAGAEYIISPNVNLDVIFKTKELGLVSMPGAMTPSEVMTAYDNGADIVKLFPANYLGLAYIKDLRAPISHVKLLATGGITEENFEAYLNAGMCGAGVSSRLCDKKLIAEGNWTEITRRAQAFSDIANK